MSKQTVEMRRLVLHAADQLAKAAEVATAELESVVREGVSPPRRAAGTRALVTLAANAALAEQTLRLVASCMDDEEGNSGD